MLEVYSCPITCHQYDKLQYQKVLSKIKMIKITNGWHYDKQIKIIGITLRGCQRSITFSFIPQIHVNIYSISL